MRWIFRCVMLTSPVNHNALGIPHHSHSSHSSVRWSVLPKGRSQGTKPPVLWLKDDRLSHRSLSPAAEVWWHHFSLTPHLQIIWLFRPKRLRLSDFTSFRRGGPSRCYWRYSMCMAITHSLFSTLGVCWMCFIGVWIIIIITIYFI